MLRPYRLGILLAPLLLLIGCDPIRILDGHTAELRIEGSPDVYVQTVISQHFAFDTADLSGDVILVDADTAWLAVGYQATFDLRHSRRFLVRALTTDPPHQPITVSVWVNGELHFQRLDDLTEGYIQYIYVGH